MVYLFIRNLFACQDGKFYNKCVSPFLPRSPSPCFLHGRYPCTPWRDSPPGPRSASSPTRCPPRCPSCGGSSSTVPLSKEQRHHIQLARSTLRRVLSKIRSWDRPLNLNEQPGKNLRDMASRVYYRENIPQGFRSSKPSISPSVFFPF